jgi:hypothetical protein
VAGCCAAASTLARRGAGGAKPPQAALRRADKNGVVYNGAHLGPVGSLLVSEVFGGMLRLDRDGIVRTRWTPEGGTFTLGDFLRTAGVVP